ncbi:ribose-5-phosphate isomerase rki1 [Trapelia coarctata]|nr:ribose-5-phosphate isomerase rki1 [Trapelia coarctata]
MDIETAKRNAAHLAVRDHFPPTASYIGIGSGTTIVYVLEAIVALKHDTSRIRFVPTGYQSRQNIIKYNLTPIAFDSLPDDILLDVAFDGADEIDEELNCIKGGGACLYQEKLVAMRARKFVCVADHRKLQPRLLTHWPTIPIEIDPLSLSPVLTALRALGSPLPTLRTGPMDKAGPLKTDQSNFIIDAPFPTLLLPRDIHGRHAPAPTTRDSTSAAPGATPSLTTDVEETAGSSVSTAQGGAMREKGVWEVEALAREIKLIEGVLSVGLFVGEDGDEAAAAGKKKGGQKPVAAYFGMADGSVVMRSGGVDVRVE